MYWLLLVPLCPIQHPFSKCLVLLNLCLMCSAQLCMYAMYIVWTRLSALPFSHLHCLSLRPGFTPRPPPSPFPLYFPCYNKTGTCQIYSCPKLQILIALSSRCFFFVVVAFLVKCWLVWIGREPALHSL